MLERPPPDAKPMTPTDAYGAIVQQFRDVPQGQWHEIAAREVVRFVASGRLTQQQAAEVSSLLTQRLARMLERNPPIDPKRELGLERRFLRKKRYQERCAAGLAICPVEHDAAMIQFLIDTDWLDEADADDPRKVGVAVAAMWRDACREKS